MKLEVMALAEELAFLLLLERAAFLFLLGLLTLAPWKAAMHGAAIFELDLALGSGDNLTGVADAVGSRRRASADVCWLAASIVSEGELAPASRARESAKAA